MEKFRKYCFWVLMFSLVITHQVVSFDGVETKKETKDIPSTNNDEFRSLKGDTDVNKFAKLQQVKTDADASVELADSEEHDVAWKAPKKGSDYEAIFVSQEFFDGDYDDEWGTSDEDEDSKDAKSQPEKPNTSIEEDTDSDEMYTSAEVMSQKPKEKTVDAPKAAPIKPAAANPTEDKKPLEQEVPTVDTDKAIEADAAAKVVPPKTPEVSSSDETSSEDGSVRILVFPNVPRGGDPNGAEQDPTVYIDDDWNKSDEWISPRYSSAIRHHRVLFTGIIVGFFILAVATVLFTFHRGFIIMTQIIRRRATTGVNYSRMEEELDPAVFQQQKV